MPNTKWQPSVGRSSIPSYFSQSNLIIANVKVVNFGRFILRIIAEHNLTPKYVFKQLSLGCPVLVLDLFLASCRTRLGLSKKSFSDKDLRDTFALINCEKTLINAGDFTAFLVLIQKLDEKRKSNVALLLTTNKILTTSLDTLTSYSATRNPSVDRQSSDEKHSNTKVIQKGSNIAITENLVLDFRYSLYGVQLFTIPFHGTWRILARAAHGGNFAMQHGGYPAECCASISTVVPGQTFVIGVGEGGHLGGGGGATFVALLDEGVTMKDSEQSARLLLIMGGGGGAGLRDGVEASCHKKGVLGLNGEVVSETNQESESKPKREGGHRGRGLRYESLEDGSKRCTVSALHRFCSKARYGGKMGGGDAASAFSLSCPKAGPVTDPNDFTFLAGGGGGGGYRGAVGVLSLVVGVDLLLIDLLWMWIFLGFLLERKVMKVKRMVTAWWSFPFPREFTREIKQPQARVASRN